MAFCCSSSQPRGSNAPNKDRWTQRHAGSAAVQLTNLFVNPGTNVPTKSLLTHDNQPTTHDLAGHHVQSGGRHKHLKGHHDNYYSNLTEMSPAHESAPIRVRQHSSHPSSRAYGSTAGSIGSSSYVSSRETGYRSIGGSHAPQSLPGTPTSIAGNLTEDKLAAWSRDIDSREVQLESCLKDLEIAIGSENFEEAKVLRVKRDALKARPLPAMPIQPTAYSAQKEVTAWQRDNDSWKVKLESCLKDLEIAIRSENFEEANVLKVKRDALKLRQPELPPVSKSPAVYSIGDATGADTSEIQPVQENCSQASTQESYVGDFDNNQHGNGGRTESSGLGFLFSVWTHNPAHTPKPDDMHR